MGVPNNETFSMQDVADEIGVVLNWNIITANANAGGFDPAYNNDSYAPANSMLRFRNYQHIISLTIDNLVANRRDPTGGRLLLDAISSVPVDGDLTVYIQITNLDGAGSSNDIDTLILNNTTFVNTGLTKISSVLPPNSFQVSASIIDGAIPYPSIYTVDYSAHTTTIAAV